MDPITLSLLLAGGGAALSGAGGLFGQEKAETKQLPTLSPQQISAQNQALQTVMGGLRGEQGPYGFAPIEARARRLFETRTVPGLMERFGGGDTSLSSGARAALLGSGREFEEGLAAQHGQYNLQRLGALTNLLHTGLSPQFQTMYIPEHPNAFGRWAGQVGGSMMGLGMAGMGAPQESEYDKFMKNWRGYTTAQGYPVSPVGGQGQMYGSPYMTGGNR